ncbi:MAG: hypothetical protein VX874_20950 [Pseudomonadota bacterium]|nr:hypothetical protein [Pseudomonadota bacterium]
MSTLTKSALAAVCAVAMAAPLAAKPGNNGNGWGVGGIPPGHCKKIESCRNGGNHVTYERNHDRYDDHDDVTVIREHNDVTVINNYTIIEQPSAYGLPALPSNQIYVRQDNQIYSIVRDTQTVVEAIGIVSNLLN